MTFPLIVETDRLVLRRLTLDDAGFILELLNQPPFLRYIGDKKVRTLEDARRYLREVPLAAYRQHGIGIYRVELAADRTPIGTCGLLRRPGRGAVELGFAFLSEHGSRGYALESAAAVMEHGRRALGLGRVEAIVQPDNRRSIRLLERLGFQPEGTLRLPDDETELRLYAAGD